MAIDLNSITLKTRAPYKNFMTCALMGDSITAPVSSFPAISAHINGLRVVKNAGIGGHTSAQMLARFDTDISPYSPDVVFIMAGTNDIGYAEYVEADTLNNIAEMARKSREIGAVPIICNIPPRNNELTDGHRLRFALRNMCELQDLPFVDPFLEYINPATGEWIAGVSSDGTHPLAPCYYGIAEKHALQSAQFIGVSPKLYPVSNSYGGLVTNALMLTDTDANGLANGWSGINPAVYELDTDPDFHGNVQRFTTNTEKIFVGFSLQPILSGKTSRVTCTFKIEELTNCTLDLYIQYLIANSRIYFVQGYATVGKTLTVVFDVKNTDAVSTTPKLYINTDAFVTGDLMKIIIGQIQQYQLD